MQVVLLTIDEEPQHDQLEEVVQPARIPRGERHCLRSLELTTDHLR